MAPFNTTMKMPQAGGNVNATANERCSSPIQLMPAADLGFASPQLAHLLQLPLKPEWRKLAG
jgi:hypothetical protein